MTIHAIDYRPQMPQRTDVPIGCIGSGFIMADCHLVAYRAAGFHPVAIASRRPEQARNVALRHSIESVFDDYRELLRDERIQVVDIAVPPDVQGEVIDEVLRDEHNRGILAQKTLASNYAEGKQIVDPCERAGVT
ncbi:MAG: Gfo/Idh/MocA family protein, partial [Planctomycetaceae bacterium]